MRFLFDIAHPAHAHFFHHMITALAERGHVVSVLSRHKDVTTELLDSFGIAHQPVGRAGAKGRLGRAVELIGRDIALWRLARAARADVIVTRNPSGVQAARLAGITGVFDTDDGSAAGVHFRLARPFARYITTPACLSEDFGPRHSRYPGYKQSAYLHPNHFAPDEAALKRAGINRREPFFVVRFVQMTAAHDKGEVGIAADLRAEVVRRLARRGRVFVSWEGEAQSLPGASPMPFPVADMHHALAHARLYLGDSQTMAAEAAYVGTPSLHLSSFSHRLAYLWDMEQRYGLLHSFIPANASAFLERLDAMLTEPRDRTAAGRSRMLAETVDVASWYVTFLESLGGPAPGGRA